jgi:uncharacterized protein
VPPVGCCVSGSPPAPALTDDRRREYAAVLASATSWASTRVDVAALGLAGSWARGAATMASDVDLVVLTDRPGLYTTTTEWIEAACGSPGRVVRTREWGPLTERRVRLASALLVEWGFAPRSWAEVQPLDDGTARVVADGFAVLYDPIGLLDRLVAVVTART